MIMEWIKIDKNNLPKGQILAACFDLKISKGNWKIIGYLRLYKNSVWCFSDCEEIQVTHYVDIDKFDL